MIRRRAELTGVVQGVGFRPFVMREAVARGLTGWVKNGPGGATLEIQGKNEAVLAFLRQLRELAPVAARVDDVRLSDAPYLATEREFRVIESSTEGQARPSLPPDLGICSDCRREISDPQNRRYGYAFTNCTACGPRATIVERLPYDRERTSMAGFALCNECRTEYLDLSDRRYHAEPIACPRCGPVLSLVGPGGQVLAEADSALPLAADWLERGGILGLKGLGGFQLLVDATDDARVELLRRRKAREAKPFAVMFRDEAQLSRYAMVTPEALALLRGPKAPIVLLPARGSGSRLAPAVAPRLTEVGALLPYTPLHQLLLERLTNPVVCTSGNLSGEPLCLELADALERLGHVADAWLTHNRPITRPMDDSVVRVGAWGEVVARRARGYAPSRVARRVGAPGVLALGAHYKSAVALLWQGELVVSQHLGDLDTALAVREHARAADELVKFYRAEVQVLACDLHPDYASTRLAETLSERWGVPLRRVQHHHAHVAAVLAEHAVDTPVLGLAWDGTGLGTDGVSWGSEALLCQGLGAKRVAHLQAFPLPGGDRAQREPRRVLLGLAHELGLALPVTAARWFDAAERVVLEQMLERNVNCPLTCSMGRLFDAVAAAIGIRGRVSYEGQAAMELEVLAAQATPDVGSYPLTGAGEAPLLSLCEALFDDLARGVDRAVIARRFHQALIDWGVELAEHAQTARVVLSGGCFQNQILSHGLEQRLRTQGFEVLQPRVLPPGDGQIAVGQAWLAAEPGWPGPANGFEPTPNP